MQNYLILTDQQKNIWNTEMFFPNSSVNHIGGYINIEQKIDSEILEKTANLYVQHTDSIRSHFIQGDNGPLQYISDYKHFSVDVVSISDQKELDALCDRLLNTPFSVIDSDLFKFQIYKFPNGRGGLIGIFHHLVCDAWTMGLLISRLMNIYSLLIKDADISIEDYPSFSSYVIDSTKYINSNKYSKDKKFWENDFKDEFPLTYISHDHSSTDDFAGSRESFVLNASLYSRILDFCKKYGFSPYTFLMGIYTLYLANINDTNSALVGTPVLNRTNAIEKQTSGMFVSTVPFKIDVDYSLSFSEYIKSISVKQMAIFRHQKYPYLELLESVKRSHDISENLYDFVFSYQNAKDNKNEADVPYSSSWITGSQVANSIEAHFYDMDNTGKASIFYNYQTSKFSKQDIRDLHARILNMIKIALGDPQLKDIPVVVNTEKSFINKYNNTKFNYNKSESLIQLFRKQVRKNKDKTAVIFKGHTMSYAELEKKSNQLANYLKSHGVGKNEIVGIMLNRSFDIHVAMLGILKIGAAFMLIDPSLPDDRVQYMLQNADVSYVITNLYLNMPTLNLNEINKYDVHFNPINVPNSSRFCVLYTSGSTGLPKGVELSRLNVINLINSFKRLLNTSRCNMYISTSTVSFDMFIVENYLAILSGKTVVLADEDEQKLPSLTSKLIETNKVDFLVTTPSKISLLMDNPECLQYLKVIQLGGEALKSSVVSKLKKYTSAEIHNGYGPSECCACSSDKLITDPSSITIGKPFLNVKMYIMNHIGNLLPINVPGELVIQGDGVGIGYINKLKFNGVYHTGDIAMLNDKGELVYIGRRDNQVKFHGLRIELDEITKKLYNLSYIHDAVCVIKKVNNIDSICAFIKTNYDVTVARIRKDLSKELPNYMVPSHFVFVESFYTTLNGKIDTKKLPEVTVNTASFKDTVSPTEDAVKEIWKKVLNLDDISSDANFFDIGGDSLCSIRIVSDIYTKLHVQISVNSIFEYPTIHELASEIDRVSSEDYSDEADDLVEIKKHDIMDSYPVSYAQRGIFYESSLDSDSTVYNTPFGILFDNVPNTKKLEYALNTIINSNEAFRTYFVNENNDVVQKLLPHVDFKLNIVDGKNDDFVKPFSLDKAPLIHLELDKLDDGKALLQVDIHHIICDAVSISVFAKELCELYNSEFDLKLADDRIDYIDYSLNQQLRDSDKNYWNSQFSNGYSLLNMPTQFERSSFRNFAGSNIYSRLDNMAQIEDFCKKNNVTPYMFMLSCFYILLYKYTMQNDITIGSPIAGRTSARYQYVIGMFVNTLPLKQNIQSSNTFSNFLGLVKGNCLNAFAHQDYPFDALVKDLAIPRDVSRNPLFDVMFTYESSGLPKLNLKGLNSEYVIPRNDTSKFDFSLEVTPNDGVYSLRLEYATSLFTRDFMATFLDSYKNIVSCVLNDADVQIAKIKMLSDVPDIYPTSDYPKDIRIIDLFEKQVLQTPDNVALVCDGVSYTYKELDDKVNRLANTIKNMPVYKDKILTNKYRVIGIMMNRHAELIISMLAILKVGAGYLPLDPTYPDDRVKYILEDSRVDLVLTEQELKDRIPVSSLVVDDSAYGDYESFDTECLPEDVGYMIYTSGSTGKPKGVLLKQSSVINFIYAMCDRMPLKDKCVVSITTMCFDIFVFESILPLCTGMKVVLANNDEQNNPINLNKLCMENGAEIIQTTPSKFKFLMSDTNSLDYIKNMKIISLAGEPFPLDLFKNIRKVSNARVYNMYGPTETTVGSTLKELTDSDTKVTIGTPLENTKILVLDNDMNQVPIGVPGNLYIGGAGVAIGYINKPELTAGRFIDYDGRRIYNSGDIVKILPNMELDCLGRSDFQVKIHGLRIELLEIENLIRGYKDITDVVVTVKNFQDRDMLCAYYTANSQISISLLKHYLQQLLPTYMVPVYLVQIKSFSYTPNGKIDRKVLPAPKYTEREIVAPRSKLEKDMLTLWKSILSIEKISIYDNFFDIGGDSLCALKLQLELMKAGYNVNYGDIFKHNTIAELASFISGEDASVKLPTYNQRDFRKINSFIRKNSTFFSMKLRKRNLKNVLLVGATGFLGIHVLAELLKNDDIKIYCIIRENSSTSPENKLKNKFKYYFGSDLSNLFGTRLFVFNGDISEDNFKLSNEQYDFLGNNISTVINCAAIVKHYGDYQLFEKVNVIGVKNIITFCEKYDKEFCQTSTISVSGNTMTSLPSSFNPNRSVNFGENKLFINQTLDNVYVRSKFEAEKIILEEIASQRLKGIIFRIGNITNRFSDGKFQENYEDNAFLNRLKAFLTLKMCPSSLLNNYAEFSPVDKVAEAIVTAMQYYTYPTSILHIYNSKHLYISDLFNILEQLGLNVSIVDDNTFKTVLKKWLYDNNKADKIKVLLNDLDKDNKLVYKTNLHITNDFTLKFLNKIGFDWPDIDKDYIEKILKNINEM